MRARDLFVAGFGLAAVFLQLPIADMVLKDPQSLHLGAWNGSTFLFFSLLTFVAIPLMLGLALAALCRAYPRICAVVLAMGISFMVAVQVNVFYLRPNFPYAPWRPWLSLALFMLPVVPLLRFREQVVRMLKVSGLFGPAIFVVFTTQAAPSRLAIASAQAPAARQYAGPPVFFLTFEKVVSAYLTDEHGRILKDRFPNVARFVHEADYYPQAYGSSNATVYALKTLYSGRQWTTENDWWFPPNLKSILGATRRTHMLLDVLTEYCHSPDDICVRTIGQDNQRGRDIVTAWYKAYLNHIIPNGIEARVIRAFRLPRFNPALDIWERELARWRSEGKDPYVSIGLRQFERLNELLAAPGEAPTLTIMHNFISDGPDAAVTNSVLAGGSPRSLEELEAARERLIPFDVALGELLDRLKASGVYDEALIMITADTGYDPKARDLQRSVELPFSPDLMRVLLAIKRPRQREGRILLAPIHQVDVLPTILDDLGIDPEPFHFEGIAVTSPEQADDLARRPVQFAIASAPAGILYYELSSPQGPLRLRKALHVRTFLD